MSATNSVPAAAGQVDTRPYEPSMEEILASIRRIIADDQSLPGRVQAEEVTPASVHVLHAEDPTSEAPVDDLSDRPTPHLHQDSIVDAMMQQGSIANPQFPSPEMPAEEPISAALELSARLDRRLPQPVDGEDEQEIGISAEIDDDRGTFHEEYAPLSVADPAPLFSSVTNSSVASAFNVLAASRLADNSEELLGMARDMIRPLLRTWLDDNLPSMVERLVREEIERVARGGR